MTIADRLKRLVVARGGSTTGIQTIEEAVGALENLGGGGSGVGIVNVIPTENGSRLDKTLAETRSMFQRGPVFISLPNMVDGSVDSIQGWVAIEGFTDDTVDGETGTAVWFKGPSGDLSKFFAVNDDDYPFITV